MSKLTVIGTVVLEDIVTTKESSPAPPGLGGSAIYAAVAARFHHEVDLIGVAGTDFPRSYEERLKGLNINLNIEKRDGKTFYWKAEYEENLVNRKPLELQLGVYDDYMPHVPQALRDSKYVLIANLTPRLQQAALAQLKKPDLVLLGTIDHSILTERPCLVSLLPRVDGFIANEAEMKLLAGLDDPVEAAKNVATLGPKFVIVTLASEGAVLVTQHPVLRHQTYRVPAYPCGPAVRDPTGAGDSFAGGLIASLIRDQEISQDSLRRAMLYGTALASFCVEQFSIQGLCQANWEHVEHRVAALRKLA
jgi:sugar/nucleoside kinase (ribokinase family)